MLQQTRVDTVIPYYERFMSQYPTLETLADAPEAEVLKMWEGLGYYSRARNLQAAVREVRDTYGGVVPDQPEDISRLKGVGPYTAGAILSIAYGKPEPAVDGNVMRVLSRYFLITEDVAKASTRVKMEGLIREIIPKDAAGDFNQGLMELGALVCTPKSPTCLVCPVMEHCAGRIEGMELELPVKKKAKPPRPERRLTAIIEGVGQQAGKVLIRKRPDTGLLASMWELPHTLTEPIPDAGKGFMRQLEMDALRHGLDAEAGLAVSPRTWFMAAEHTFSHIHWDLDVYICSLQMDAAAGGEYRWIDERDMVDYAFPNVFLRILKRYFGEDSDRH